MIFFLYSFYCITLIFSAYLVISFFKWSCDFEVGFWGILYAVYTVQDMHLLSIIWKGKGTFLSSYIYQQYF